MFSLGLTAQPYEYLSKLIGCTKRLKIVDLESGNTPLTKPFVVRSCFFTNCIKYLKQFTDPTFGPKGMAILGLAKRWVCKWRSKHGRIC